MATNSNFRKGLISVLAALFSLPAIAQVTIRGVVTDKKGETIPGANVYFQDTYDGATTDLDGYFEFATSEQGEQTIVISFIGYNTLSQPLEIASISKVLQFELTEEINKLDGVVITAGAFEASDEKKSVVLKPLDIATTAGATADIPGALNTLPGTQTNGESGRLFVRGGTGEETKVFIDGMLVPQFYNPSAPNTPGRSRFSPFLFKGTSFSTGGYSAEYGQALSSTLSLNSIDLADDTETNLSFMTVGGEVSHSRLWDESSLFAQVGHINLNPYNSLVDQVYDFEKGHTATDGILSFRKRTKSGGMVKVFSNFNTSSFRVNQFNVNDEEAPNHTSLNNDYYFLNTTYKDIITEKWSHRSGASFTLSRQDLTFNETDIDDELVSFHLKSVFERDHNDRLTFRFGSEWYGDRVGQEVVADSLEVDNQYQDHLLTSFGEVDYYLSSKFVLRSGLRAEYSTLLDKANLSPRVSLAYMTTEHAQISAAFGQYYQHPESTRLLIDPDRNFEKSTHYILNYQITKQNRVFRVEGYYKDYDNLLKFDREDPFNPNLFNQQGDGFARGVDLFWRDGQSIKNVDYWISYSFLDTKRDFRDFPTSAVPGFASRHNLSIVYKHFVSPLRTQFGATYDFTSGRPFHNPNEEGFNQGRISNYHNLSFNAAFLYRQHIILYTSITNLTGRDNIFGYQYADRPDANGQFDRVAIGQPAKRFFFVGLFITISNDKSKNQLENL